MQHRLTLTKKLIVIDLLLTAVIVILIIKLVREDKNVVQNNQHPAQDSTERQ
jgi:hypothetical protein